MSDAKKIEGLAGMRVPFSANQISKLPKRSKDGKTVWLDYVGHAALTDRLLSVDPQWNWVPLAVDEHGLPTLDQHGGLWIKLTVCGMTRLGYGSADGKTGGNAIKELIGDALRNAAMRFGAALDLWHKGDLHGDEEDDAPPPPRQTAPPPKTDNPMAYSLMEILAGMRESKTHQELAKWGRRRGEANLNAAEMREANTQLAERKAELDELEARR